MKREAISYGRFSSKPQERGDSTRRQREAYEAVCRREAHRLEPSQRYGFGKFFDAGKSGSKGDHLKKGGHLGKLVALLESNEIDPHKSAIVIDTWDRFSRLKPPETMALLARVVALGCPIAVCEPACWLTDESLSGNDWINVSIAVKMAYDYADKLRRNQKSSWDGRRLAGKPFNHYCPSWLVWDDKSQKFIFKQAKATELKKACLLAIDGLGAGEIRKRLGKVKAKDWQGLTTTFRQISLKGHYQPLYADKVTPAGNVITDHYPALLTDDEWYQLQHSVQERLNHKGGRGKGKLNLFADLVYNQHGERMTINNEADGTRLLKPRRQDADPKRRKKGIELETLEWALLALFVQVDPDILFSKADSLQAKIDALTGKIDEGMANIAIWSEQARHGSPSVVKLILLVESDVANWTNERETLLETEASQAGQSMASATDIITTLDQLSEADVNPARAKLRKHILGLVERIDLTISTPRVAGIRVTMLNGQVLTGGTAKDNWEVMQVAIRDD